MLDFPGSRGVHTIFLLEEFEEAWGEVVPELSESFPQFATVDGTRAVSVKVLEDVLPVLDVLPETSELVEPDSSTSVNILLSCELMIR